MWEIIKMIAVALFLLIIFLFVGGCSSKQIEYVKVNDNKINLYAGEIQQINLQKYETQLYNVGSTEYACIKLNDYSIVVKNYQELKSYIKQQKDIIDFYENQIKN